MRRPARQRRFLCDGNGNGAVSLGVPPAIVATFDAQTLVLGPRAVGGFTASNGVEPSAL